MDRVLAEKIGIEYEFLYTLIPQYNSIQKIGDTVALIKSGKSSATNHDGKTLFKTAGKIEQPSRASQLR